MSGRINFANLVAANGPIIAPSMLKCDYAHLDREVALLEAAGAEMLHWDVMDGHFVPNLSYGAMLIKSVRQRTDLFFDTHLMVSDPERYLDSFLDAGSDAITIHIEAVSEPVTALQTIRQAGVSAGLAINPETPTDAVISCLDHCDHVLVMSVNPGFGGQQFMPVALDKLRLLKTERPEHIVLSVDGGIDQDTILAAAEAGADVFVAGSSIFEARDYQSAMQELKSRAGLCRSSKCG